MRTVVAIIGCICAVSFSIADAETEYLKLDSSVVLESGDTWTTSGERYRLYGVQSCLRGTYFRNKSGMQQDCGDASMAFLAAFIKDTGPLCTAIAKAMTISYVVCVATVGTHRVDLGTALIAEGYAFAALDPRGLPVNPNYAVAEQRARQRKAGLWQFPDVPHPSMLLSGAARQAGGTVP